MIFNGHTEQYIDTIDEELFTEIQVMYADGLLGNRGIFDALTPITTLIFNYLRGNSAPIRSDKIFPWVNEYSVDTDHEITASDSLLGFMSQAPNFNPKRFKNGWIRIR